MKKKDRNKIPKLKETNQESEKIILNEDQENITSPTEQFLPIKFSEKTPPIWENFSLTPGVILEMDGKTKAIPKFEKITPTDLENPDLRLTKTEYFKIIRKGNLSREGKTDSGGEVRNSVSAGAAFQSNLERQNKKINGENFNKTDGFFDKVKVKKKKTKSKDIKINSVNFYENLTNVISEYEEINLNEKEELRKKLKKKTLEKEKLFSNKNEIDIFNSNIIKNTSWGNNIMERNFMPKINQISKNNNLKNTLGNKNKRPREKLPLNQVKLGINYKFPPSHAMRKTFGNYKSEQILIEEDN